MILRLFGVAGTAGVVVLGLVLWLDPFGLGTWLLEEVVAQGLRKGVRAGGRVGELLSDVVDVLLPGSSTPSPGPTPTP